jgi:hypothetical protein
MGVLIFFGSIILLGIIIHWVGKIKKWKNDANLYEKSQYKLPQLNKELNALDDKREAFKNEREREIKIIQRKKNEIKKIANEKAEGFPWLANAYAEYFHLEDLRDAKMLRTKKYPAPKSAEKLKEIAKKRRKAEEKFRTNKYLIDYYENLFPWLEDFKEYEEEDLLRISNDNDYNRNKDNVSNWLTEEEYKQLSITKKNQLALERYKKRKKSKWQIGKAYERYVGYSYEQKGYNVEYPGIKKRLEDMGRDLIASRNGQIEIIQCKYWSKRKKIHEKHIFQLFGTTIEYFIKNHKIKKKEQLDFFVDLLKGSNIKGVFVTNINLSEMASKVANALNIKVVNNYDLEDYPIIKCNISKVDGEKIYHLPFDQQYDTVKIEPELGEKYVATVKEAEKLGFRRAFRWSGS